MRDELQTLNKALDALLVLAQHGGEMKASEMEAELGISRSSLYRIIGTLRNKNFVEAGPQGTYHFGLSMLSLGLVAGSSHVVDTLAKSIMERVVRETEETVMLTGLVFPHAMCLARIESPLSIRLSFEVGKLMPLCAGASGKILLGTLSEAQLRHYIQMAEERGFLRACRVDAPKLLQQVETLKRDGYVQSLNEVDDGAFGIAVPVLDRVGKYRYGLSLAGPAQRLRFEKFLHVLKQAARDLSEALYSSTGGDRSDAAN
ncbi:MAG: IclR family transcriptional regulator [Ktedonobacteraceae bacterium]|nr:IclR family transcriptional regulator [Ktedonobacteraceae bacterium]MBO0789950.1 IclR family transcriptional regulator [Ktedonobacteraceae bacterium]